MFRWPLDHLFHSEHFQLVELTRLPSFGSDHFPLQSHLQFVEEQADRVEPPSPSASDNQQADEILKAEEASIDDVK